MGEFYGALIRQMDAELAVDGFDPARWAREKLAAVHQQGTITAKDAERLTSLLSPTTDGPAAARLFDEAMEDPESSPTAVAMLSIAKYKAEHGTTDSKAEAHAGAFGGIYLAALGPVGLGIFVAIEVAEHVEVTASWS